MIDDTAIHLALRNRLLTVSGLPSTTNRAWENKKFTPTQGSAYITDSYVPGPPALITVPADTGTLEHRGLYVVQWYGIEYDGFTNIRTGVKAILAKFSYGTRITCTDGQVVRIGTPRGVASGPTSSQIVPTGDGWAVCTIKIPFWLLTTNAIAA
jgi:hypothetical protein